MGHEGVFEWIAYALCGLALFCYHVFPTTPLAGAVGGIGCGMSLYGPLGLTDSHLAFRSPLPLPDQKRAALLAGKMLPCRLGSLINPMNSGKCLAACREFSGKELLVR